MFSHYGVGSAFTFRQWSKDLIDYVELVAIQLPEREERLNEPLLNNVSEIVGQLCLNFNSYIAKPIYFLWTWY